MPYVIEKATGRRRYIRSDLLEEAMATDAFELEGGQTILMEDKDGDIGRVNAEDYLRSKAEGGRPITEGEKFELSENIYIDKKYNTAQKRSQAGTMGVLRGATIGLSDYLLEGAPARLIAGRETAYANEQERKILEDFRKAESIAGEALGIGASIAVTGPVGAGAQILARGAQAAPRAFAAAKAVSAAGAPLWHALSPAAKALSTAAKYSPTAGVVKAGEAVGKLAARLGPKGASDAARITANTIRLGSAGFAEGALYEGVQGANRYGWENLGTSDEIASDLITVAGIGGTIDGSLSAMLALAPGGWSALRYLKASGEVAVNAPTKKVAEVVERLSARLGSANAKTVLNTIKGNDFSPGQLKKLIDEKKIFEVMPVSQMADSFNALRTGYRQVNDKAFSIDTGVRSKVADLISDGTPGLNNLKKDFDNEFFTEAYLRADSELADLVKNTESYLASSIRGVNAPGGDLARRLQQLAGTANISPERYNRIVKNMAKDASVAVKRLNHPSYMTPVREMSQDILGASPGLPSHFASTMIELNEKTRHFIYESFERRIDNIKDFFIPTRDYFQAYLTEPALFGEGAELYSKVNGQYVDFLDIMNTTTRGLPWKMTAKEASKLVRDAQFGDKSALKTISQYKKLLNVNANWIETVVGNSKQSLDDYAEIIAENTKAYNSVTNIQESADLIRVFSPTENSAYWGAIKKGVKDLKSPKGGGLLGAVMGKEGVAATIALGALSDPTGAVGAAVAANVGGSLVKSFRDPYRQLSRMAKMDAIKQKKRSLVDKGVKKIIKNIGKDGRHAEDSMRLINVAAKTFMAQVSSLIERTSKKDEDLDEKAVKTTALLASDPHLLNSKLDLAIGGIEGAPEVREDIKKKTARAIIAINEMRPKEISIRIDPLTGEQSVSGPDYAFDKVRQVYAIAQDPLRVIGSAGESKTISRDMAMAFKRLHPDVYSQFVAKIRESMIDKKTRSKTKYSDKLMLSTLFDIPMEASITAPVMSALQSTYQEEEQPEPRPQRGLASLKSQVDNTMTPSQRAMG